MALVVKDRVKETTTTTGTGTVTLAGADLGFQSFSVLGDGNTTYYTITSGTDWEVGVGTYTASGTTLSRDTILESSNAGSAISLSGTSTVFCTYPAERSVNTEDIGSTVQAYDADTTKNDVANTFTANQTINGNLTVDTNTLYVDSTNNRVGIGTSSPVTKFQVSGYVTSGGQNYSARFSDAINSTYSIGHQSGMTNLITDTAMAFYTSNTERMRIGSGGDVGIGTSTPQQKFNVKVTTDQNFNVAGNSTLSDGIRITSNADSGAQAGMQFAGSEFAWTDTGTERMRIDSSGNVGIGTTSPTYKLQIQSGASTILAGADSGATTLTDATQKVMRFGVPHYTNAEEPVNVVFASITPGENGVLIGGGTGLFNAATRISFYTAANTTTTTGTERMRITSAGNVGIGTTVPANFGGTNVQITSPSSTLFASTLWNSGSYAMEVLLNENSSTMKLGARSNHHLSLVTNDTERLRIASAGNVGIGTSIPDYKLHVANSTDSVMLLESGNTSSSVLLFGDTDSNFRGQIQYNHSNDSMNFFAGGIATTDMIITSAGSVGIGTSSPQSKLHSVISSVSGASYRTQAPLVIENNGSTELQIISNSANGGQIRFGDGDSNFRGALTYEHGADYMIFNTSASERMRIDSSGNVGIGTSSPLGRLSVLGEGRLVTIGDSGTANTPAITVRNTTDTGYGFFNISTNQTRFFTEGSERMRIDASGNVLVGTTSATIVYTGSTSYTSHIISKTGYDQLTLLSPNVNPTLSWAQPNSSAINYRYASIRGVMTTTTAGSEAGALTFLTSNAGVGTLERMRIDPSGNLLFNSGYGSVATAYGCRAWVNFNGTGTVAIRASGNVSSVTDNGTGIYAVNFSTAMPDANYSAVGMAKRPSANDAHLISYRYDATSTASILYVATFEDNGTRQDTNTAGIAVFR